MTSPFDTLWTGTAQVAMSQTFGELVSIRRGAVLSSDITAQRFLGERSIEYDDGGVIKFTGCDWIIAKADYTISSVATTPRPGDRIIDSDSNEWELTPIEGTAEVSEQPGGVEWLVMTKKVV